MSNFKVGANFAVFAIFFGLSLIDAVWSRHWIGALLWLVFGLLFARADSSKRAT